MRQTLYMAAIVLGHSFASSYVVAATIISSPSEMSPPTILVSFEAFPAGGHPPMAAPILTDQWRSVGFLISDSTPSNGAAARPGTYSVPPHSGLRGIAESDGSPAGGFIEFRFVVPTSNDFATTPQAGLWVQNGAPILGTPTPSTVEFFDLNDNLLETITTVGNDFFAGLIAPEGIARIRVSDPDYWLVDDLQFSPVPEPAGVVLATVALVALAGRRRRAG